MPWDFVSRYCSISVTDCQGTVTRRFRLIPNVWPFGYLFYAVRNGDGDIRQARLSQFLLREELRRRIGEKLGDRGLPQRREY